MSTTCQTFGNKQAASTGVGVGIGATANAGDVLIVGVALNNGTYLEDPTLNDDGPDPFAGWIKVADVSGSGPYHGTWWVKTCLGGESAVGVTPGSLGPADVAFQGYLCSTLTFPTPYIIDQGYEIYDPGVGNIWTDANAPTGNGQTYVGVGLNGPPTPTSTGMTGSTSGGGQLLADSCNAIALANNQEGTNTTADRPVFQDTRNDAELFTYVVLFGFSAGPALAGVAGAIDATGELTTTGGTAELSGVAGMVDAAGRITQEGGDSPLAGLAGVVSARGRLRVTTPPPTPIVAPSDTLGCGVYDVYAFTRGGGEIVGNLEFDSVAWGRKLDATSQGTLTIDGQSNLGALERCCALLGSLEPFEHELGIYRSVPGSNQKRRVWSGPITRMRFPDQACIVECYDLSVWLMIRTLHANHNYVQKDLIDMWVGWVEDAMSVDNTAGLYPTVVALAGQLGDRLTTIVEHDYAADVIAEIATTGIDWTTIDRVMQAGPVLKQPAGVPGSGTDFPLLIDESFRVAPEIIIDGLAGGNCWFVNGGGIGAGGAAIFGEYGPAFAATPDHVAQPAAPDYAAIETQFGRIETTVSETKILDQPSIDQAARTRYDLTKRPMPYITGGELLPTAPLPIEKIIPGLLVNVHLARACKPIAATMRMNQLDIAANNDGSESVNLGLEPIGTAA